MNEKKVMALIEQLSAIEKELLAEMNRVYPPGAHVVFCRSSKQVRPSRGVVVCNSVSSGAQVRVRYDGSRHVVGLHPGYTWFYVAGNPARAEGADDE